MTNYFDKIKQKVNRRSSESTVSDLKDANITRLRSNSISIIPQLSRSSSQTKYLIQQETSNIISKKLSHILADLGLHNPIPIKTTNNNSVSKSVKLFVSNSNDVIFLAPASLTTFTYEDVDGSNYEPVELPEDANDSHDDSLRPTSISRSPSEPRSELDWMDRRNSTSSDNSNASFPLVNCPNYTATSSPSINTSPNIVITEPESPRQTPSPSTNQLNETLNRKIGRFHSPNYLCTKIDSDVPIPHTFAVIIELAKDTVVKDVTFEFQSQTAILWPMGDPYNRTHHKEKFKIGQLQWTTTLSDYDYYINTTNSNDIKIKQPLNSETLAKRTKEYKLVNIRDTSLDQGSNDDVTSLHSANSLVHTNSSGSSKDIPYRAGLYVFLLPILLPAHIPASISSINGSLVHNLSISFNKISDKLNRKIKIYGNYNLPMVRTPPSFANSIADKPIYVNRVWNDSLHYFITFPKKYISLGSEHVINIKLIPLVKDVIIKRVKFNVLEKITYVSKDLSKEYDYDSEDPFYLKPSSSNGKYRERVVSLCELKTKPKSSNTFFEPFKEEIVKCPDNNLLFACYEPENNKSNDFISTPLDINIALPFLTTNSDLTLLTSSGGDVPPISNLSRKASIVEDSPSSGIIGTLETNLIHTHDNNNEDLVVPNYSSYNTEEHNSHLPNEAMQKGITTISRALYPDSNFRHIQIHHRLQVCFRISKPDAKDNYKMHHYEVVVDTPLILLSAKCNTSALQLPKYDEIDSQFPSTSEGSSVSFRTPVFDQNGISIKPLVDNSESLPTFEEAISRPKVRSVSVVEDPLDGLPQTPPIPPAYEEDDDDEEAEGNIPLIEDMFDSSDEPTLTPLRSKLRQSLCHSFAPISPINSSGSSESTEEVSPVESTSAEENMDNDGRSDSINPVDQSDCGDNVLTSSSESNTDGSIHSKIQTAISSTSEINNDEIILENVKQFVDPTKYQLGSIEGENMLVPSTSEDDISLNTQESVCYEQRLPLLQHYSSETISRLNRKITAMSIQLDINSTTPVGLNSTGYT